MKIIKEEELKEKLFDHPYDSAPDYHAAMSVICLSEDASLLIGYWHAPPGRVPISYSGSLEYILILDGRLCVETSRGSSEAKKGDWIACGGRTEDVVFEIKEYVRAAFIVYPQEKAAAEQVLRMMEKGDIPLFPIQS